MRRILAALAAAWLLTAGAPGAAAEAEGEAGLGEVFAELPVPEGAVAAVERALATSPRALELQRRLALAESRHRKGVGDLSTRTGLRATVEARREGKDTGKGVGGAIQWVVQQPLGRTELTWAVGPGVAARWKGKELEAAPVVGLTARHPFGQGPDVRRDKIDHELAEEEVRARRERMALVADALKAYGDVERARAALDARTARLELERARQKAAESRRAQGEASPLDVYEARRRAADAEDALEDAALALDEARRALFRLLGDGPSEAEAEEAFAGVRDGLWAALRPAGLVRVPAGEDGWVEKGLGTRPETALADETVRLAEADVASARRRRGWSGEWVARATYPDPDSFPGDAERKATWRVGAQFNLPLSDPGSGEAVEQAKLRLEEALAEREQLESLIEDEVRSAFRRAERSRARWERARREYEQAAWSVDVAEANLAAGLATAIDVLEAKVVLAMAEQQRIEARYDVVQQVIALWQAAGMQAAW